MDKIEALLEKKDIMAIKEYLDECQANFYMGDSNKIYKDFLFGIEQYDVLISALGINEETGMIKSEMVDRKDFLDIISIFETEVYNLYFVRMEQYGYADEDAVVYRMALAYDIDEIFSDCKDYMEKHDFIKSRKRI